MRPPNRARRALRRALASSVVVALAYVTLLCFPSPLFAHTRAGRVLVVHSDEAIAPGADAVIADAEARLARSPLFVADETHDVYVCNASWRWRLLAPGAWGSGAYALGPFARPIFTRPAHFDRDRLVGPSGREATGERTLAYFLAHEVTHTLTAERLGPRAYLGLPAWVREGYADYVARGTSFDYEATRERLLEADPDLDPRTSGLYLRYVLLVAHLLDREGWTPAGLLTHPPDRAALEARVRAGDGG